MGSSSPSSNSPSSPFSSFYYSFTLHTSLSNLKKIRRKATNKYLTGWIGRRVLGGFRRRVLGWVPVRIRRRVLGWLHWWDLGWGLPWRLGWGLKMVVWEGKPNKKKYLTGWMSLRLDLEWGLKRVVWEGKPKKNILNWLDGSSMGFWMGPSKDMALGEPRDFGVVKSAQFHAWCDARESNPAHLPEAREPFHRSVGCF